jgi:hypothetical protein
MKDMITTWLKSFQHKMNIANVYHGSAGLYASFIVLAVSTIPTMPGVRALNHPALLQGREAFRALRTRFDFDTPPRTMRGHPGVEGVIVILLIRKDRAETRKVTRLELSQEVRGRDAVNQPSTGNQHGEHQPERIDQYMPLAPVDFLAAILAALRSSHLGGLDRLALNARGAGCGLTPCFHTSLLTQCFDQFGPRPVVAPLGKVVIDGTLGEQIVGQHLPLTTTPIQGEKRVQDFPHVHLARATASCALLGVWDHWFHDGPLRVRQI